MFRRRVVEPFQGKNAFKFPFPRALTRAGLLCPFRARTHGRFQSRYPYQGSETQPGRGRRAQARRSAVREGWGKKKGRESILLDSSLAGGQSFGLVTATPLQYGRLSLPCAQSGRRSDAPVSQGPRLRRLREGPAPSQGLATDAGSELLPDAQPLAPWSFGRSRTGTCRNSCAG
jgi:hypothetical protein